MLTGRMGDDGAKFMEANYYLENPGDNLAWAGQTLTFSGTVDSATLDSRYAVAFIKVLDVDAGYATTVFETASIISTGAFSLTYDVAVGNIAQVGQMTVLMQILLQIGAMFKSLILYSKNKPSMQFGFAAFVFVAIRRRK